MEPTSDRRFDPHLATQSGPLPLTYLQRYGLAILSVGVALGAGLLLQRFDFRVPSALLLFAVAISAWYGRPGSAVLAVILSAISFNWFFVEPVHTFYIHWSELPYFIIFVGFAALLSWFAVVRRRVEAELRQSHDVMQEQASLLSLTHDAVYARDKKGVIRYWNRGAERLYGWPSEHALGKVAHELLKAVFPLPLEEIEAELLRTGRWEGELAKTHKDGTQLVVTSRWSLKRDDQGAPVAILVTSNDITERKKAEEALRRLNRELRAISNCNQILMRATDEQRLLEDVCRIVCEDAGYRAAWVGYAEHDEAKSVRLVACHGVGEEYVANLGITWADTERGRGPAGTAIRSGKTCASDDFATDPRLAPWRESALLRDFRSGIALPLKDEHANAFGNLTIYSVQPNAFASEEEIWLLEELAGDLAFGIVTLRSRAAREKAEQEVALLSFALEKGHEAAFLMDGPRLSHVNEEACRRLGYTRAELLGMSVADIDPDFPVERWSDHWRELKAQRSLTFESRHRTRDGRIFPVEISANYFEYGGRDYNLALVRDITERKRTEEALRRSEAYLAEGQRLAQMGSWAWSPATPERNYWSEEMNRIFGFEPEDAPPALERFLQRIHSEDYDRVSKTWEKSLREKAELVTNYRIVLPDGTVRDIHIIGHPVLDDTGELIEYVGTAMDVTERKLAEDELRKHREHLEDLVKQRTEQLAEAKARAEAANRAKSSFLANMSHELRTPLNAVLGFSRLLKNDPDVPPPQKETLDVIVRSGEHLLNLINNVLDLAKIESGRVALKESEVDLNRLLQEMQSLMGAGAADKGLRFALEHDPDLPRFVAVDVGRLRQVLLNLLGNAIKFTDSGGVKLRARLASLHGSDKAKVRFEVEDSGPGISPEDCQRIFVPFVQLGDQAPAPAGTGLGLAICKQYVDLMGGQMDVSSQPGKGSVFYFEIPVSILSSVGERDELKHRRILGFAEGQPRHRLLIVEDQPENRLLLRRLLDPLGFELREAVNGQEAVALFEQWHPHLIWMDIRMPVMDGLEAVRRIRSTKAGAETKIIALTAHALEEESGPIMAAGCDDLVRKPFREQELFEALARHLRLKFIYEEAPRQESAPEALGLTLRPEQLDALPAELLRDLRQAVIELDTARTHSLIEQVSERDASLGRALDTLATRLDYKRLLKLLEKEPPETGQTI